MRLWETCGEAEEAVEEAAVISDKALCRSEGKTVILQQPAVHVRGELELAEKHTEAGPG